MAEVAASIIGISTFGIKLTLTLYEFGSTTSSAKQQTDHIAKHVTLYSNVLELLAERLEYDAPIISDAAIDLVEELYDQSDELFNRIRALLPRKDNRDELSFLQKIGWNFKKTKVELLVGELDYLKSTVQLLVTVIFTGRRIRSYRKRKSKVGEAKAFLDRENIETQCLKVQNALVEQANAAQQLPNLRKEDDRSDNPALEDSTRTIAGSTKSAELVARQSGIIAKFQSSLSSIEGSSHRQAYVLKNSTQLLHDLLLQWTTINSTPDEVPILASHTGSASGTTPHSFDHDHTGGGPDVGSRSAEEQINMANNDRAQSSGAVPASLSNPGLPERRRSPYATSQNGYALPDTGRIAIDENSMHPRVTRRRPRIDPHNSADDEDEVSDKIPSHNRSTSSTPLQGSQPNLEAASKGNLSAAGEDMSLENPPNQSTAETSSSKPPQIVERDSRVRAWLQKMCTEAKTRDISQYNREHTKPPNLADLFSAYSRRSFERYELISRQMNLRDERWQHLPEDVAVIRRFGSKGYLRQVWEMGGCELELFIPEDREKHVKHPQGNSRIGMLRIRFFWTQDIGVFLYLDGHESWEFQVHTLERDLHVAPDGSETWTFNKDLVQGADHEGRLLFLAKNGTTHRYSSNLRVHLDPLGLLATRTYIEGKDPAGLSDSDLALLEAADFSVTSKITGLRSVGSDGGKKIRKSYWPSTTDEDEDVGRKRTSRVKLRGTPDTRADKGATGYDPVAGAFGGLIHGTTPRKLKERRENGKLGRRQDLSGLGSVGRVYPQHD